MSPANLFRLSAQAAMLSGILIIIKKTIVDLLLPLNPVTNAVGTFGLLIGMFSLTGIYLYQREESGRLGLIGYLVIWFGLGAASGPDYAKNYIFPYMNKSEIQALLAGPTKLAFLISALLFLLGVILFSIALLRTRKFSPLAILLFLIGFTLFSLSFLFPDVVSRIGEILGAVSIIWLGYTMWTDLRKAATIQPGQTMRA